jgi:hypothetical protein
MAAPPITAAAATPVRRVLRVTIFLSIGPGQASG